MEMEEHPPSWAASQLYVIVKPAKLAPHQCGTFPGTDSKQNQDGCPKQSRVVSKWYFGMNTTFPKPLKRYTLLAPASGCGRRWAAPHGNIGREDSV